MNLTHENYHSLEANLAYWSWSQLQKWRECPARTRAVLFDGYKDQDQDAEALLVGQYVDTALLTPHLFGDFKERNADRILKKSGKDAGKPYAPFEQADKMITVCQRDPKFMQMIYGPMIENQRIITFEWLGVWWKCQLDAIDSDDPANPVFFTDVKTTKSIRKLEWSDRCRARVPFYELWNYWGQLALYRKAIQMTMGVDVNNVFIAAVSKEECPDHELFKFSNFFRFQRELDAIEMDLPDFVAMKQPDYTGDLRPCGKCPYCVDRKRIEGYVEAESFAA